MRYILKNKLLFTLVLFSLLTVLIGIQLFGPAQEARADAKSLYLIGAINANPSPVQAWGIQSDGSLVHQFTEGIAARAGGAVGIALEPASQALFITYEVTNVIQLVDARTMLEIGTTAAPGASNLAGIVADEGKSLIYTIDRNTGKLYSYSWNAATKTLTLQAGFPKTLPNLSRAFGVALDELNGRLFIADGSNNQVEYYNTTTWAHLGTLNVGHYAIGIAVDSANGFVYTSAGWASGVGLWKWDLATGTQTYTSNSNIGVMGIAVDQNSHLVYATTGYSGDDLRVFNPDLSLRHTYALPRTYTDSSDGRTYTFSPSPTGIVIPGRAISYNPMNLTKSDGLAPGQTVSPGSNINYTLSFQNGNPNPVTGVVVTDTLPPQTTFVSASDGGILSGNTVTWNIGTVASGASRSVTLVVQVNAGTPGGTTITNQCSIDSDQTGPAYATEDTLVGVTNQPPTANPNGPYNGNEGSPVSFNGTGSTDPEGQPLTYAWSFGDGGTGSGATPSHIYADNGTYTVTLTVTDAGGLSDTKTTTATIANVAPTVNAGPDVSNISGQVHQLSATYSDPAAADTHTATVNWGDGSPVQNLGAVQGGTVSASHQYFIPGNYNIEVCVTDDDGGKGCDTAVKTVKRLVVQIDIKPGSWPNSLNLNGNGVVPVGVFGGPTFDVNSIDLKTVFCGVVGNEAAPVHDGYCAHIEDINGDGTNDMVFHFREGDLGISTATPGNTEMPLYLTAKLTNGVYIEGKDIIRITPNNENSQGKGGKGPK